MLASLIAGFLSGETLEAARRARSAAIAYLLAAILGLLGFLFLLMAAYLWTARHYGAIEAAIGFGVTLLVIAGLDLLIHRFTSRRRIRRDAKRRRSEIMTVAATTGLALLPTLLRGKGGALTLLAPAAAAVAYMIYKENAARPAPPDDDLPLR